MLTLREFYANPNVPNRLDYREYVYGCLAQAQQDLGTEKLLEALSLSLGTDLLSEHLEYICRDYEIPVEEFENSDEDEDDEYEGE